MTDTLTPFAYGDQPVRVVTIDGDPWFVLTDLTKVLGLTQFRTDRLDDGLISSHPILDSLGRTQTATIVSEAGMYEVVIRSDKPEAAAFRRWITSEVLPSIRKHGGYLTPDTIEQVLTDPDTLIRLATTLKEERALRRLAEAERLVAQQRAGELEAQAAADAPKVIFADAVAASHTSILVGDLAKLLRGNGIQVGATRLFKALRRDGYLINRNGSDWNMPTQKSMELGLFEIKETAITHADGHVTVSRTPKVTGKGQRYFVERYLDGRLTVEAAA